MTASEAPSNGFLGVSKGMFLEAHNEAPRSVREALNTYMAPWIIKTHSQYAKLSDAEVSKAGGYLLVRAISSSAFCGYLMSFGLSETEAKNILGKFVSDVWNPAWFPNGLPAR